jgi:hypothetical protein
VPSPPEPYRAHPHPDDPHPDDPHPDDPYAARAAPAGAPRTRRHRRAVAAAAAALLAVTVALPALAEPSPEDVERQKEKASRLADEAAAQREAVSRVQAELERRATRASRALEEYQQAQAARARAAQHVDAAEQRLDDARARVDHTQRDLGRYAAHLYRSTGGSTQLANLSSLVDSGSPTEFTRRLAALQWVGEQQDGLLARQRSARQNREDAALRAETAVARARAAQRAQRSAKRRADALVAEQKELVARQAQKLERLRGDAQTAEERARKMAHARRVAERRREREERRREQALAEGEPVLGEGGCEGGDVSGYDNGQIPESLLCPLWGTSGHLLTAEAAAAFNAMSKDYAARFGSPICITDSYRSYEIQVDLYEEKPDLAAVPGTSNHGWARAVDLCGGIESFHTVPHEWMRAHAPAYGWYHPSWAREGSDREEPWHWEYGG